MCPETPSLAILIVAHCGDLAFAEHPAATALSKFTKTGPTDPADIVTLVRSS